MGLRVNRGMGASEVTGTSPILHTHKPPLINTPLQRGVVTPAKMVNRFSGFTDVPQVAQV
jgi:hypothetical protein